MSEHTKGRLSVEYQNFEYYLETEDEATLAKGLSGANAHRLSACWNAMDGVSPPILDCIVENGGVLLLLEKASSTERELAAARALLREVYEEGNLDMGDQVSKELDNRISSYLDACDTLKGAPNAG